MRRLLPRLAASTLVALTLAAGSPCGAQTARGYVVIVHPDQTEEAVTLDRLSRLFLKSITRWDDGRAVLPVDLGPGSPVREEFSRDVHQRRTAAIKSFWQRMIFSGRDTPPPELNSDEEVVAYVRSRPGAIGYVSAELAPRQLEGVTVLPLVDDRRAGGGEGSLGTAALSPT